MVKLKCSSYLCQHRKDGIIEMNRIISTWPGNSCYVFSCFIENKNTKWTKTRIQVYTVLLNLWNKLKFANTKRNFKGYFGITIVPEGRVPYTQFTFCCKTKYRKKISASFCLKCVELQRIKHGHNFSRFSLEVGQISWEK